MALLEVYFTLGRERVRRKRQSELGRIYKQAGHRFNEDHSNSTMFVVLGKVTFSPVRPPPPEHEYSLVSVLVCEFGDKWAPAHCSQRCLASRQVWCFYTPPPGAALVDNPPEQKMVEATFPL